MCQAFSCLITKSKKVYWKAGVDSHDKLHILFVKKDKELVDDKEPPENTFARIEISPKDGNYLDLKKKWVYQIDERVEPDWLNKSYEKPCRQAWMKWKKDVYSQFNLKEALKPIHPFKIKPPKITKKHIEAVRLWASVRASVGASVGDSVWDSVGDSVWDSVRDSVGASVRDSVGTLFPNIKKWEYIDYRKKPFNKMKGKYPFEPAVWLWKRGLVSSFDGEIWRLHGGKDAKILWEGENLGGSD